VRVTDELVVPVVTSPVGAGIVPVATVDALVQPVIGGVKGNTGGNSGGGGSSGGGGGGGGGGAGRPGGGNWPNGFCGPNWFCELKNG